MILAHSNLVPPDNLKRADDPRMKEYQTEYDVRAALLKLGHEIQFVTVDDDIAPIKKAVDEWKPDIAFNLLEAFADNGALDYYIVSYLDMLGIPYTGCNPRGLLLARDKALSKKLLSYHRIHVPRFKVFAKGKKISRSATSKLPYPMIIKSTIEQGSVGIAQASYVSNADELVERVTHVLETTEGDAIAEQYIEGRELYVTVLGNRQLQVLPIRELVFRNISDNMHRIATYNVKWNDKYRKKWGIEYQFANNLPNGTAEAVNRLAKRIYRVLDLSGYARIDLRLSDDGKLFVLEANPNAGIASDEDATLSAQRAGMNYEQFIQKLLNIGLGTKR